MTTIPVQTVDLRKDYPMGRGVVHALDGISLDVGEGQFLAIMGPSGSGKSTLLHILGGLDRPTSGKVRVGETDLAGLPDNDLAAFRRRSLGFVFQSFNLLPTLSAWENVALPLLLDGVSGAKAKRAAADRLKEVGLEQRMDHRPGQLSGGEAQRVALARALTNDPVLILADEPTGNLDSATGGDILALLRQRVEERGCTLVMVTHDDTAAAAAHSVVRLKDGLIVADGETAAP